MNHPTLSKEKADANTTSWQLTLENIETVLMQAPKSRLKDRYIEKFDHLLAEFEMMQRLAASANIS
jgi:hypothetical protein